MSPTFHTRRIASLTLVAVALLGLTACTGSPGAGTGTSRSADSSDQPGDGGQSTADACALIQESIQEATAEFESAATADPAAVVDAMSSAAERLAETATQVTNDEVAAVVPALQEMFTEVAEVMDAIAQGDASRVDDLSQLGTKFQQTSETFQEICAP
jgi:hypothetical protein